MEGSWQLVLIFVSAVGYIDRNGDRLLFSCLPMQHPAQLAGSLWIPLAPAGPGVQGCAGASM